MVKIRPFFFKGFFEGFEGFRARKIRGFFSRVFPVLKNSRVFSVFFSRAGKFGKSPPQAGKMWIFHPKSMEIPLKSTSSITVRCLETEKNSLRRAIDQRALYSESFKHLKEKQIGAF